MCATATCACPSWSAPLRDWDDVEKRIASSAESELAPKLDLATKPDWVAVYTCRVCGCRWAKEFPRSEMHGGGPACLYAIDAADPNAWLATHPGITQTLRRDAEDRAFYRASGEERVEPRCAAVACSRGAISQSAFCRAHHFERVTGRACPFGD
jgi:hypothetical protein